MERNPFQSVNNRRNKLSTDRGQDVNQVQQSSQQPQPQPQPPQQQLSFQAQTLRSVMQPQSQQQQQPSPQTNLPARSMASSNWRSQPTEELPLSPISSRSNADDYGPFDPTSSSHNTHHTSTGSNTTRQHQHSSSYTGSSMDQFSQQRAANIPAYNNPGASPQAMAAAEMHLDASYAYCYDRGNGQYTRLIPADMLPALKDIPKLQQGKQGMLVLPQPRGVPSNGRSSNTEPVSLRVSYRLVPTLSPPNTPTTPSDNIQSRIDNIIVASTPPTPTRHHASLSMSPATSVGVSGMGPGSSSSTVVATTSIGNAHQQNISQHGGQSGHGGHGGGHGGHVVQGTHGAHGQQPQRRPKIYCDKWVHEGVCAFTQQGCKYKHEMPFDKVTQHQLGLFHGFPAWWKKHQAELSRQREVPAITSGHGMGGPGGSGGALAIAGEEPARLSGDHRFMGRSGSAAAGHSSGASIGSSGMGTRGEEHGMGHGPTGGLPTWRRSGDFHHSEPKSLGAGRGMNPRNTGATMRNPNPLVSYGSPFGPIGPPSRTSTMTSATIMPRMADYAVPSSQVQLRTGGISIPAANPYSSLESLEGGTKTESGDNGNSALGTNPGVPRLP
ncbi:hypothetical protein M426DRAFT_91707 [Hypoxylon sp. CI-4A]|nr:hypothetical protein M426DRAFT_91707 [Hypoxylon sp. CI-4A]